MTPDLIAPAAALAHVCPGFLDDLTGAELLAALWDLEAWLRPEQKVPQCDFRTFGIIAGRGFGKTLGIAYEMNRRVEAGECNAPALMAPTEDRTRDVQVKSLVEMSPPWFRAEEYRGSVRWPNGVTAESFTPEAPGRSRSGNFDLTWMCEIVDWPASTRREAFDNLATATRIGRAQILWDTTSKGKNDVIAHLLAECERDPAANIVRRGTTFDNPMLSKKYLRAVVSQYVVGSRRYQEEIEGKVFAESAGALWQQHWLDEGRRLMAPTGPVHTIVSLDPSLSDHEDADDAGIAAACRDSSGHVHVLADYSGRMTPDAWAAIVVDRCVRDAAGFVYERNHAGDMPRDLIRVKAAEKGLRLEVVEKDKPIPPRRAGVIYCKGIVSDRNKETRAEPAAALYQAGRVHHVGALDLLELEQTTWEPGSGKSPNRLDACVQAVNELAGIKVDAPKNRAADVTTAAAASRELSRVLGGRGRLGI